MNFKIVLCAVLIFSTSIYAEKSSDIFQTSFEQLDQGSFTEFEVSASTWTANEGHAEIHKYARTGSNGLHILGGEDRVVEFSLAFDVDTMHQMTFWAERWTSRNPFKFRIEALVGEKWNEIYNGDSNIKVGRSYLNKVNIDLSNVNSKKFRFICSSPEDSGILIDDLSINKPVKMKLESVTCQQDVSPVVIGGKDSQVLLVKVNVEGNIKPLFVSSLQFNTNGTTDLNDIENAKLFFTGLASQFRNDQQFGRLQKAGGQITFTDKQQLAEGANHFWLTYKIKDTADLFHLVDAECRAVTIEGDTAEKITPQPISPPVKKRIATALRDSGDDGVPVYRIPGLATTNKGTLIAVYDIRHQGWADLPADIDIGMSRSTDAGQTWEPMKTIMDMGEPHNKNGIGDPSILVDRKTGTIWVAALWSSGNNGWNGSGPGMTPEETGQLMLTKSDDDGITWSKPFSITQQIKNPKWRLLFQGPGKGITMRNGTIVFPAQFKDENNMPHSTIIYSRDHGGTWSIGTGAKLNTTEAQVVELNDGSLMLNMRDNRGGSRSVYVTHDMGETWIEHPSSRSELPEPVCMASLIRFASKKDGDEKNILLFANPAVSSAPRRNMTIKASTDEGLTWPEKYHKLIHEPESAGYSCMTKIDKNTIGILYEGGNTSHLVFEKLRINEIVQNE